MPLLLRATLIFQGTAAALGITDFRDFINPRDFETSGRFVTTKT